MCGIVGYVGRGSSRAFVMSGLEHLEYRGYDSAGFACIENASGKLLFAKAVGSLQNLARKLDGSTVDGCVGVGHTRWATHGAATELNAHPHFSADKTVSVVHNGIIENYGVLKQGLVQKGYVFSSDTDTEVIAHLFDEAMQRMSGLEQVVQAVVEQLQGAFACVVLLERYPDYLIAIRRRSPLCIGLSSGQQFVASDAAAFAEHTKDVLFMPDSSYALVERAGVRLFSFAGMSLDYVPMRVDAQWLRSTKEGYEHFMLKEIYEQKRVLQDTVAFCRTLSQEAWEQTGFSADVVHDLRELFFVACGTSAHAAQIAAFFFEQICQIRISVELASEFRHRPLFGFDYSVFVFLSQSGETADTLEGLRAVHEAGLRTFSLVNVPQSTMVRESDGYLLTQAKREVSVASTKSFTSQVALLYWLAFRIAYAKKLVTQDALAECQQDLLVLAEVFEEVMERYDAFIAHDWAPRYAAYEKFIFLGRQISYPLAREAALKLKEIAYCFVDCYQAGELKHGPIALVEPNVPVFLFSVLDESVYRKLIGSAQEVKARGGRLVIFAFEGQDELIALADDVFVIPHVKPLLGPLAMTGIMQLCTYHIARVLGHSIDKPRNLAKSVTVE